MILIGQYDSPFVRRVGIALTYYGLAFEHRAWSAFDDAFRIRPFNPLVRVPTLLLDSGEALIESTYILDYIDSLAPAELALLPKVEPERRRVFRAVALATGLGDKAVNLFYEQRMHKTASDIWEERLRAQIDGALNVLEMERAAVAAPYWFGDRLTHADIAVAVMWRFIADAHPGLVAPEDYPALAAMAARLEVTELFRTISQPFIPPN